jgi:adenosine deaminase/adenosine deaminase CECR1
LAQNNESLTETYFSKIKYQNDSAKITEFVSFMPKGGDIHHHYTGAIPVEVYLDWAKKMGKYYNTDPQVKSLFVNAPCKNCMSINELQKNTTILQRWSIAGFPMPCNQIFDVKQSSNYFFTAPNFGAGLELRNEKDGFLYLKEQALKEKVQYIETIYEAPSSTNLKVKFPDSYEDSLLFYQSKKDSIRANRLLALMLQKMESDKTYNKYIQQYILQTQKAHEGIDDSNFTLRLQTYVFRLQQNLKVFKDLYACFKTIDLDKTGLFVGVNIVGPENSPNALNNYWLHMQMFKLLKQKYPRVRLALHAGELVPALVKNEYLQSNIKNAIEIAGAERIGHGIDIAYEKDMENSLKMMKARDIPVEINITSNEFILGVGIHGNAHPVMLYHEAGVPIIISSDDPGVSGSSLTNEYFKLITRYSFDYKQIKQFVYNSIQYSFMEESRKKECLKRLDIQFSEFEKQISSK